LDHRFLARLLLGMATFIAVPMLAGSSDPAIVNVQAIVERVYLPLFTS
jgi:hypothetical protein